MAEDFDRSFDFFLKNEREGKQIELKDAWTGNFLDQSLNNSGMVDSTFLNGSLEFSVIKNGEDEKEQMQRKGDTAVNGKLVSAINELSLSSDRTMPAAAEGGDSTIRVAVHEQISAMYDDFSQEGAISVTGSIHIKVSKAFIAQETPFCLVLKEVSTNVQKLELTESSLCEDVSQEAHDRGTLYPSDRVLRVSLHPDKVADSGEVVVATYSCVTKLRPVPLLIKSRVRSTPDFVRVGFKIRANPTNEKSMKNIVIMMAVPPDVDGEHVKTSRRGGSWEELKRTLCWAVDELEPGKALEIQAQFAFLEGSGGVNRVPKFPVVVRCDYPTIFSTLDILNEYHDTKSTPVNVEVTTSTRILHRKV